MDYKEIINKIRPQFEAAVGFLEKELAKLRAGRATPALVEDIEVDYFGQKLLVKQLGTITAPEPRQIIIQPWDRGSLEAIEKAVFRSGSGLSPVVDKDAIRIHLPPITEEFRKNLLRILSEKQEEARQTMRRWRDEAWKDVQEQAKLGAVREDDKFRAKEDLQKLIDEYSKKIDLIGEKKKREIIE